MLNNRDFIRVLNKVKELEQKKKLMFTDYTIAELKDYVENTNLLLVYIVVLEEGLKQSSEEHTEHREPAQLNYIEQQKEILKTDKEYQQKHKKIKTKIGDRIKYRLIELGIEQEGYKTGTITKKENSSYMGYTQLDYYIQCDDGNVHIINNDQIVEKL